MADEMTAAQVATMEDTGVLWEALRNAREHGDHRLVRAIEQRMRELAPQRRFAHLSDHELASQIRGLTGNRAPENMLAYSPAEGQGMEGAPGTASLNRAIRADQKVGVETTLAALLEEWRKRNPRADPDGR